MTPIIPYPKCGQPMYRAHRNMGGWEVWRCQDEECDGKREFKLDYRNIRRLEMGKEAEW